MAVAELDKELETYEAHREQLLGESLGKYVLIFGDQIIATYDTERDAINEGYRRFGNVPFFVKRIAAVDEPANFLSRIVSGQLVPSFTVEAADLANEGPVVDVTLSLQGGAQAALTQATPPQPVPAPVAATMLVDTGASHSAVKDGFLGSLGLHPVGTVDINTPSSQGVPCALYAVRITLPHGQYLDTTVIQAPPSGFVGQNIDGLIGRDVLRWAILIYLGQRGQFTLSF